MKAWVIPQTDPTMPEITVKIDRAGRVSIPKQLREKLHLSAGDTLTLQQNGDQLTLRPVQNSSPLTREKGLWVWRTGKRITTEMTNRILDEIREEREKSFL